MKPREYCCCAIPINYAGVYVTLLEQFVLGILAGTLSVATPSIVGASTPSSAKWIFAIICYAGAAIQVLGFYGVWKERPILFRRYTTLHLLITLAAFSIAAVWIILSATRHTQAKSSCENTFFIGNPGVITSEGNLLCDIFPWVDVGIMGGLWLLLAVMQVYMYIVISSFSKGQERDHLKYDSLYDMAKPFNNDIDNDIPLNERGGPWDSRPSTESLVGPGGYHTRHSSIASVSTVLASRAEKPNDFPSYPPAPETAYTQEPGATPHVNEYYDQGYSGGVGYPEPIQNHPGAS
ncbi:hypothetical protein OBBRIDRAFT_871528 [Obba rivulosa]|uniref:Uncharacterized protein n=1 Tax=Obba rivulosa TaxID=1052685 RepID=A0A8E2DTT3_9APHY|nr:hypothetical protein OBBRIDRAFT_871528 [Obba rivulosa]